MFCFLLELLKEIYLEISEYGYKFKKFWKMNVLVFNYIEVKEIVFNMSCIKYNKKCLMKSIVNFLFIFNFF